MYVHEAKITLMVTHNTPLLVVAIMMIIEDQLALCFNIVGTVQAEMRVESRNYSVDLVGIADKRKLLTRSLHFQYSQ